MARGRSPRSPAWRRCSGTGPTPPFGLCGERLDPRPGEPPIHLLDFVSDYRDREDEGRYIVAEWGTDGRGVPELVVDTLRRGAAWRVEEVHVPIDPGKQGHRRIVEAALAPQQRLYLERRGITDAASLVMRSVRMVAAIDGIGTPSVERLAAWTRGMSIEWSPEPH